jgi:tRNA (guanine-N7-)-methyltransferase
VPGTAGNSRTISTNQRGVNRHLNAIVTKHLTTQWRRPIAAHSRDAFHTAQEWLADGEGELILDSCCGVGESSRQLAIDYAGSRVIGIDKSASRLARSAHVPANCLLLRADVNDMWRLIADAGWSVARHYLLYPNPYPRRAQFSRRWHGSPAFPTLLSIGGHLEVRSNWQLYVHEFAQALSMVGVEASVEAFNPKSAMTPFERKYAASGQTLWRLTADARRANLKAPC